MKTALKATVLFAFCIFFSSQYSFGAQTYFKVFYPVGANYGTEVGETYHCDVRTDLILENIDGIVDPNSDAYVEQYDPILSTSVLCPKHDDLQLEPIYEYTNFPGDLRAGTSNTNEVPLQTWGVNTYCFQYMYGAPGFESNVAPTQVILQCVNGKTLEKKFFD